MSLVEPVREMSSVAFDRAIEKILALRDDAAGVRAGDSLRLLLHGVYNSAWPDVAWKFSQLTGDGFPLEFTFSSQDDEIRYTCEVAGPEMAAADRLTYARHQLAGCGVAVDEGQFAFLSSLQAMGPLFFGTWVGGRHGPRGNSYKFYVECPAPYSPAADQRIAELVGTRDLLSSRATDLRIVGYEPTRSRMEFYFKTAGLEPWEVILLLRRFGLEGQQADLFDLLGKAWGKPVRDRLPSDSAGFSFAVDPDHGPVAFSLHSYARSVFGGDARIRRRVLELAQEMGWNFAAYQAVSEPLAKRDEVSTFHGIVSFTVAAGRQPVFQIGLRPPEENC
jgi:hypothetical protein